MTTQVFRGRTLLDAKRAATAALGDDAVVLTARRVKRPGITGFLGGVDVEIAAAAVPATESSPAAKGPFAPSAYQPAADAGITDPLAELRAELRGEIRAMKIALGKPQAVSGDLAAEVASMREAIEQLAPPAKKGDKIAGLLRAVGLEGSVAAAVGRVLRAKPEDTRSAPERLRDALGELVLATPWPLSSPGRVLIAAVGPTGVGKTTTLAKLATRAKMQGRSVALVTCDTFRVGAVEQTARYGELLGVRAVVARDASELRAFLAETRADVVLVDTCGREPTAEAAERLLSAHAFKGARECAPFTRHVLLCLPAAVRAVDATRVAKSFAGLNPTALAMTKMDETTAPSGLVHGAYLTKLPLSVLCAGPRVPEDISPATLSLVLDALLDGQGARKAAA